MNSDESHEIEMNISNAFDVVHETYKSVLKLLNEMDEVILNENFVPIQPKFIRYHSEDDPEGWLVWEFIKIYQCKDDPPQKNEKSQILDGPIYGIEICFDEKIPCIFISRFEYDFEKHLWDARPGINFFDLFYDPLEGRNKDNFKEINIKGWKAFEARTDKIVRSYWGLKRVIYTRKPLVPIDSTDKIRTEILGELIKLKDFKDERK